MNILITGGTGLIGRALSGSLLKNGHHVNILTRNPDKVRNTLPSGLLLHKWDGRSLEGWAHLIEETDVVINLAGESIAGETLPAIITRRWTTESKRRINNSRVDAGHALVAAIEAAQHKPKIFIQASAVGYYGPRGDEPTPESTPTGDDFLANICQAWEDSTAVLDEIGIRRVVVRTGLVLAPNGGILPIMLLPFRLFAGGTLGGGEQFVPWIHIEDEVNAIRFLLENKDAHGAYNLAAPHPVRQRELAQIAGRLLRRPSFIPTPGVALKLVLGEKASLVLDGQQALPDQLLKAGYKFNFENLEPALKDLLY